MDDLPSLTNLLGDGRYRDTMEFKASLVNGLAECATSWARVAVVATVGPERSAILFERDAADELAKLLGRGLGYQLDRRIIDYAVRPAVRKAFDAVIGPSGYNFVGNNHGHGWRGRRLRLDRGEHGGEALGERVEVVAKKIGNLQDRLRECDAEWKARAAARAEADENLPGIESVAVLFRAYVVLRFEDDGKTLTKAQVSYLYKQGAIKTYVSGEEKNLKLCDRAEEDATLALRRKVLELRRGGVDARALMGSEVGTPGPGGDRQPRRQGGAGRALRPPRQGGRRREADGAQARRGDAAGRRRFLPRATARDDPRLTILQ